LKIAEQKVELVDYMGSDLSVVNAARVSFHKESTLEERCWHCNAIILNGDDRCPACDADNSGRTVGDGKYLSEKDQKLIAYLAKHNHWTPFAHAFLSFRIKAPIFVARQLVKHQVGLAWNEVSRRYVDDEPEFWFPKEWRGKPENAKQGSSDEAVKLESIWQFEDGEADVRDVVNDSLQVYTSLIRQGVAPEQARMVLPQNMMTEWVWSGSLAAFARVCKLRLDAHAQAETREIAEQIHAKIPAEFEHSWTALIG
jgi:thymidylate synthase (FAD)